MGDAEMKLILLAAAMVACALALPASSPDSVVPEITATSMFMQHEDEMPDVCLEECPSTCMQACGLICSEAEDPFLPGGACNQCADEHNCKACYDCHEKHHNEAHHHQDDLSHEAEQGENFSPDDLNGADDQYTMDDKDGDGGSEVHMPQHSDDMNEDKEYIEEDGAGQDDLKSVEENGGEEGEDGDHQ